MCLLTVYYDKVPCEAAILPGNIAKNKNIEDLRERWVCARPDSVCPSTHCFVRQDGEHLPLSHQHFDAWGSVMASCIYFARKT